MKGPYITKEIINKVGLKSKPLESVGDGKNSK